MSESTEYVISIRPVFANDQYSTSAPADDQRDCGLLPFEGESWSTESEAHDDLIEWATSDEAKPVVGHDEDGGAADVVKALDALEA